uniref:EF-hand domain-containing protein n=1 Tax=Macrostomum lignano TaxID=282301 RepID=A0A1I8JNK2_9PLAT
MDWQQQNAPTASVDASTALKRQVQAAANQTAGAEVKVHRARAAPALPRLQAGLPSGVVREEHVTAIFAQLFRFGNPAAFARIVFNCWTLTRQAPGPAVPPVRDVAVPAGQGRVQDKLAWIFRLYDVDRDGTLSREEIGQFLAAVYDLLGSRAARRVDSARSVQEHAAHVFQLMDPDGKGAVTCEDFLRYCRGSPEIMKGLEVWSFINTLMRLRYAQRRLEAVSIDVASSTSGNTAGSGTAAASASMTSAAAGAAAGADCLRGDAELKAVNPSGINPAENFSFYPEGQNSEKCQSQVVPDTDFPIVQRATLCSFAARAPSSTSSSGTKAPHPQKQAAGTLCSTRCSNRLRQAVQLTSADQQSNETRRRQGKTTSNRCRQQQQQQPSLPPQWFPEGFCSWAWPKSPSALPECGREPEPTGSCDVGWGVCNGDVNDCCTSHCLAAAGSSGGARSGGFGGAFRRDVKSLYDIVKWLGPGQLILPAPASAAAGSRRSCLNVVSQHREWPAAAECPERHRPACCTAAHPPCCRASRSSEARDASCFPDFTSSGGGSARLLRVGGIRGAAACRSQTALGESRKPCRLCWTRCDPPHWRMLRARDGP